VDRSILIGLPTYNGESSNRLCIVKLLKSSPVVISTIELRVSILPHNFNILWAAALNNRPQITDFLLWHADVLPQGDHWLKTLLDERDRVGADVISSVIPIKNEQGMTSTALDTSLWSPRRYSLKEVHDQPEPTWTAPGLLLNTGLMLVDFTKPWVEKVWFQFHTKIIQQADGAFKAKVIPEDWDFSRQCHKLGVPIYATKSVVIHHRGTYDFPSDGVWGLETDKEHTVDQPTESNPEHP